MFDAETWGRHCAVSDVSQIVLRRIARSQRWSSDHDGRAHGTVDLP
jgi:hypothetical protein